MAEKFRAHKISSKWKTLTSKQQNLNTYTAMLEHQHREPRAKSAPNVGHMRRQPKKKHNQQIEKKKNKCGE